MTRDDVIRWAREAGAPDWWIGLGANGEKTGPSLHWIAGAAALAVAEERSAILRAIDELEEPPYTGYENPNTFDDGCIAVADAIRARSTP